MHDGLKSCLLSVIIVVGLTACQKAQEESAAAAKETITQMKANTIDAASKAAADAERAANEIAEAADQAGSDASTSVAATLD
jgi:hypothetical protein